MNERKLVHESFDFSDIISLSLKLNRGVSARQPDMACRQHPITLFMARPGETRQSLGRPSILTHWHLLFRASKIGRYPVPNPIRPGQLDCPEVAGLLPNRPGRRFRHPCLRLAGTLTSPKHHAQVEESRIAIKRTQFFPMPTTDFIGKEGVSGVDQFGVG